MVKTSGIRDKLSSKALRDLARERSSKRRREEVDGLDSKKSNLVEDDDEDEADRVQIDQLLDKARKGTEKLTAILPQPKNSSAFGPTVKLDKLLAKSREEQEKVKAELAAYQNNDDQDSAQRITSDGMLEVDISKVVSDSSYNSIKELTIERSSASGQARTVIVPGGKERQKNQITYLAKLSKANELQLKDQAAAGRHNKAAARSKYGW